MLCFDQIKSSWKLMISSYLHGKIGPDFGYNLGWSCICLGSLHKEKILKGFTFIFLRTTAL